MSRSCNPSPLPAAKRFAVHACGVAMVFAVPAAGYLLAVSPLQARNAELNDEQTRLVRLIDSAASVRAGVASLEDQIAATQQEMRELLDQLPDRPSMDPLIATISAAAETANAEVLSLQPLPNRAAGETATQLLRLRLRCDHPALCRFLSELDANPMAVWVAAVELRSEPADVIGRGGGLRQAELTLRVPHAAEKTFAGNLKRTLSTPPEA